MRGGWGNADPIDRRGILSCCSSLHGRSVRNGRGRCPISDVAANVDADAILSSPDANADRDTHGDADARWADTVTYAFRADALTVTDAQCYAITDAYAFRSDAVANTDRNTHGDADARWADTVTYAFRADAVTVTLAVTVTDAQCYAITDAYAFLSDDNTAANIHGDANAYSQSTDSC